MVSLAPSSLAKSRQNILKAKNWFLPSIAFPITSAAWLGIGNTLYTSLPDPARDTLMETRSLGLHMGEGIAGPPPLADGTKRPFTLEGGFMGLHRPEAADDLKRLDFACTLPHC